MAVADTFFAPTEVNLLRCSAENDRATLFFRLWTLKEAYIKAIGSGLHAPLQSFAFSFDPLRISFAASTDDKSENWYFDTLRVTEQHVLSVAVRRNTNAAIRLMPRAITARGI